MVGELKGLSETDTHPLVEKEFRGLAETEVKDVSEKIAVRLVIVVGVIVFNAVLLYV